MQNNDQNNLPNTTSNLSENNTVAENTVANTASNMPNATTSHNVNSAHESFTDGTQQNNNYIGLTGSQIITKKVALPKGIYIIAGFNVISFVVSFFDTSQNSNLFTIVMLADLILAIGLLFRLEIARKVIIWLYGITLVLSIVSIFMLMTLQQRINQLKTNYDAVVSRIDQTKLTIEEKQQLDSLTATITAKEKQTGKAITFTYVKLGITIVVTSVLIIYLTRPKVKSAFHPIES